MAYSTYQLENHKLKAIFSSESASSVYVEKKMDNFLKLIDKRHQFSKGDVFYITAGFTFVARTMTKCQLKFQIIVSSADNPGFHRGPEHLVWRSEATGFNPVQSSTAFSLHEGKSLDFGLYFRKENTQKKGEIRHPYMNVFWYSVA